MGKLKAKLKPRSTNKEDLRHFFKDGNLFVEILNSLIDPIFVKDKDGRYIFINQSAEQLFVKKWGLGAKDILGKTPLELIPRLPKEVANRFSEEDRIAMESKLPQTQEPQEGPLAYLRTKAPFFDSRGNVIGIVGISRDITKTIELRRKHDLLLEISRTLIETLDPTIIVSNLAKLLVPSFADWCSILLVKGDGTLRGAANSHKDKIKEKLLNDFIETCGSSKIWNSGSYRVIKTGIPELYKEVTRKQLGKVASAEEVEILCALGINSVVIIPIKTRGVVLGVIFLANGKERGTFTEGDFKIIQEAAHRLSIALENVSLHQSLIKSVKAKDEFLATLSHELRNPLAPILNSLQLIHLQTLNNQKLAEPLKMAERQLGNMARLLDDLLDVSRIMRGKITLKKTAINVKDVIQEAAGVVRPTINTRKHNLVMLMPEYPVLLFADPLRIEQVVVNLLNNAAKYTNPGGTIALTCREDGKNIVISVKDNGRGMTSEDIARLFDSETIISQASSPTEGLGIGLKLVKNLIELHGGTIQANSSGVNRGSEFRVTLPVVLADPVLINNSMNHMEEQPSFKNIEESLELRRDVLVVDDNEDAAKSLNALVNHLGFKSKMVKSGAEALEALYDGMPKVVLLDIGMPDMDGYEVAKKIRAQKGGESIALIAISGYGQAEDKKKALQVGFNQHITKPIGVRELKSILELYTR